LWACTSCFRQVWSTVGFRPAALNAGDPHERLLVDEGATIDLDLADLGDGVVAAGQLHVQRPVGRVDLGLPPERDRADPLVDRARHELRADPVLEPLRCALPSHDPQLDGQRRVRVAAVVGPHRREGGVDGVVADDRAVGLRLEHGPVHLDDDPADDAGPEVIDDALAVEQPHDGRLDGGRGGRRPHPAHRRPHHHGEDGAHQQPPHQQQRTPCGGGGVREGRRLPSPP
jgi:hypothetical protein